MVTYSLCAYLAHHLDHVHRLFPPLWDTAGEPAGRRAARRFKYEARMNE